MGKKPFEIIVGKKENADNQHFLQNAGNQHFLLPLMFSTVSKTKPIILST